MASAPNKREREQVNATYLKMRSDYRTTLVERPIVFNDADFVDAGKTLYLDRDDGAGFVDVASHTFTRHTGESDFRETFPHEMDISRTSLPLDAMSKANTFWARMAISPGLYFWLRPTADASSRFTI